MAGAPEVLMRERYNESADTFSFALVLLSLAVGDINYVAKSAKGRVAAATYRLGWRPDIPRVVHEQCADLAALISAMWTDDFRERPSMKEVVDRLEACGSVNL